MIELARFGQYQYHDLFHQNQPTMNDSPRADAAGSGTRIASLDSWDRTSSRGKGKVAINLCNVYEKEISATAVEALTDADLHYLVHQNRALLRQASMKQHSGSKYEAHG